MADPKASIFFKALSEAESISSDDLAALPFATVACNSAWAALSSEVAELASSTAEADESGPSATIGAAYYYGAD